jgi:geranylgeranyl reductase
MDGSDSFDAVVVGGGPAGATAATDLAGMGRSVLLIDRAGRIKPCGGAIPPRLIRDFDIPHRLLVAEVTSARMIAPSDRGVDMPINGGFVGMVDRDVFDEWLRARAAETGAERRTGTFERLEDGADGSRVVVYRDGGGTERRVRARAVIGADGARSKLARAARIPKADKVPCVFAYHEIIRSPAAASETFDPARCDVYYQGRLSPDFYAWVFPHGETTSVGVGSANKGFSLRRSVERLRTAAGLAGCDLVRGEGAPIPLKPLKTWDNGRDVVLAGDAAGVVAPASGEGIYYWAGMTLYPVTKCTPQRACDMIELYGPERLMVNSAGDWGPSKPTAVPDFILEMRKRGHAESVIRRVVYENPLEFFGQSRGFVFNPPESAATVGT